MKLKWKQKGVSLDVKPVWHKFIQDELFIYLTARKFWQEDRQEFIGCASKYVRKVNQYFVRIQKHPSNESHLVSLFKWMNPLINTKQDQHLPTVCWSSSSGFWPRSCLNVKCVLCLKGYVWHPFLSFIHYKHKTTAGVLQVACSMIVTLYFHLLLSLTNIVETAMLCSTKVEI